MIFSLRCVRCRRRWRSLSAVTPLSIRLMMAIGNALLMRPPGGWDIIFAAIARRSAFVAFRFAAEATPFRLQAVDAAFRFRSYFHSRFRCPFCR